MHYLKHLRSLRNIPPCGALTASSNDDEGNYDPDYIKKKSHRCGQVYVCVMLANNINDSSI
jgi:hypothetical protein